MIESSYIEKVFFSILVIFFSFISSWYYQRMTNMVFNKDIAFYSILVGGLIFIFIFATFWWSFPSAMLSGILGGFLYTSDVHFENINSILDDIYNYCDNNISPRFIVEGFISTSKRIPLIRKVTVHKQTNGQLLNSTMSDENGYYKLGLSNDDPVFIVCHPEDSNKKGLIHTYVIPVENED